MNKVECVLSANAEIAVRRQKLNGSEALRSSGCPSEAPLTVHFPFFLPSLPPAKCAEMESLIKMYKTDANVSRRLT